MDQGEHVDGAYAAGIGIIIRDQDHCGKVLLTAWKAQFDDSGSAEEVEALACREGLNRAAEWIQEQRILESDCSTTSGIWLRARRSNEHLHSSLSRRRCWRLANWPKVLKPYSFRVLTRFWNQAYPARRIHARDVLDQVVGGALTNLIRTASRRGKHGSEPALCWQPKLVDRSDWSGPV